LNSTWLTQLVASSSLRWGNSDVAQDRTRSAFLADEGRLERGLLQDPRIDALIEEARATLDGRPAATTVRKMGRLSTTQAPTSSCTAGRRSTPCASGVRGLRPSVAWYDLQDVWLQPEVKRFLARRVLAMTATILGVTLVSFVVARAAPATRVAGRGISACARAARASAAARVPAADGPRRAILAGYLRWALAPPPGRPRNLVPRRPPRPLAARRGAPGHVAPLHPVFADRYLLAVPVGIVSAARPGGWPDRSLATLAFITSIAAPAMGRAWCWWSGQALPHSKASHSEGTTSLPTCWPTSCCPSWLELRFGRRHLALPAQLRCSKRCAGLRAHRACQGALEAP